MEPATTVPSDVAPIVRNPVPPAVEAYATVPTTIICTAIVGGAIGVIRASNIIRIAVAIRRIGIVGRITIRCLVVIVSIIAARIVIS
jgi:hypothetical protein